MKKRSQENETFGAYCRTSGHADALTLGEWAWSKDRGIKQRTLQHDKEDAFRTLFCVADINYYVLVVCIFL